MKLFLWTLRAVYKAVVTAHPLISYYKVWSFQKVSSIRLVLHCRTYCNKITSKVGIVKPKCCVRFGSRENPSSQPMLRMAPQLEPASAQPDYCSGVRLKCML